MHSLHAQHLVIALLIIEHGRCKVIEHVLVGQKTVSLMTCVNADNANDIGVGTCIHSCQMKNLWL